LVAEDTLGYTQDCIEEVDTVADCTVEEVDSYILRNKVAVVAPVADYIAAVADYIAAVADYIAAVAERIEVVEERTEVVVASVVVAERVGLAEVLLLASVLASLRELSILLLRCCS